MNLEVAVVGVAGPVGRSILSQLDVDGETGRVLGVDERPPEDRVEKLSFHLARPGDRLDSPFSNFRVKLAVYLAPAANGLPDPGEPLRELDGVRRFLEACSSCGAEGVVVASGSSVYGLRDNGSCIQPEGASLRPEGLEAGERDLARETLVARFARRHPAVAVALGRLAPLAGAGACGPPARYLEGKNVIALKGFDPLLQFVHVEDAALALYKLLKGRYTGIYNIAPDDALTPVGIARVLKKPVVRYSPRVAYWLARLGVLAKGSRRRGLSASFLPLLRHSLLLSNQKIKRDVGFTFKFATAGSIADHVRSLEGADCAD